MTEETEVKIEVALDAVKDELMEAYKNFPDFRSAHEGVAIMDEEMCEFKEAAYWPHKWGMDEELEATQLAAMVVRYLVDICYNKEAPR